MDIGKAIDTLNHLLWMNYDPPKKQLTFEDLWGGVRYRKDFELEEIEE